MVAAGKAERELAIKRKDFHEDFPAITVICDGGWSKRSHKHTYDAIGGVAIIIGKETNRLLHIGVKNKICYICSRAEGRQTEPQDHVCYKNWSESSQAMEAAIILEGFNAAEKVHKLRYMRVIGDGDSSVFARIRAEGPVWGRDVQKLECANHSVKCLRSSLEKLVVEKPYYKGKYLTKQTRIRLTTAVRCAIRMRSKEEDRPRAITQLGHDIKNSVHHIFGNHFNCSSDFCKVKQGQVQPTSPSLETRSSSEQDDEIDSIDPMSENAAMWTEGTAEHDMEESRGPSPLGRIDVGSEVLKDVNKLLERLSSNASRLIENTTTNMAECWMSIRSKFDGGKIINRCFRGSWHARCFGSALRMNNGPSWSPNLWEKITKIPATPLFKKHYNFREKQIEANIVSKSKPENKARYRKRKAERARMSSSKKARLSYGPNALDVSKDCSEEELQQKCENYTAQHFNKTESQLTEVTEKTQQQSDSSLWKKERATRLTASYFGEVLSKRPATKTAPLVKRIIYPSLNPTACMLHGIAAEKYAIVEYIKEKEKIGEKFEVFPTGLHIHQNHQQLAASPDGIVHQDSKAVGLLEVKNLLKNKLISFKEAASELSSFCLELKDGKLQLKRKHKYYMQCQGQLNIIGKEWLDFVVRRESPHELHIERIKKDPEFWEKTMLPKLLSFHQHCMLPELACPRHEKAPGIREPKEAWMGQPKVVTCKFNVNDRPVGPMNKTITKKMTSSVDTLKGAEQGAKQTTAKNLLKGAEAVDKQSASKNMTISVDTSEGAGAVAKQGTGQNMTSSVDSLKGAEQGAKQTTAKNLLKGAEAVDKQSASKNMTSSVATSEGAGAVAKQGTGKNMTSSVDSLKSAEAVSKQKNITSSVAVDKSKTITKKMNTSEGTLAVVNISGTKNMTNSAETTVGAVTVCHKRKTTTKKIMSNQITAPMNYGYDKENDGEHKTKPHQISQVANGPSTALSCLSNSGKSQTRKAQRRRQ